MDVDPGQFQALCDRATDLENTLAEGRGGRLGDSQRDFWGRRPLCDPARRELMAGTYCWLSAEHPGRSSRRQPGTCTSRERRGGSAGSSAADPLAAIPHIHSRNWPGRAGSGAISK